MPSIHTVISLKKTKLYNKTNGIRISERIKLSKLSWKSNKPKFRISINIVSIIPQAIDPNIKKDKALLIRCLSLSIYSINQMLWGAYVTLKLRIWRWGWDSNPRKSCPFAGFQDRYIQPLCHSSELNICLILLWQRLKWIISLSVNSIKVYTIIF